MSIHVANTNLKVYIAYSDVDGDFVDKLVGELKRVGRFELATTPHQKTAKRNWKFQLGSAIADADTVLLVVSQDSTQSNVFNWEIEHALELSKRVIPILRQATLPKMPTSSSLASLNCLRFDKSHLFQTRFLSLVQYLDSNVEWLRMHTQLFSRARNWKSTEESAELLLTDAEIAAAKKWTFDRPRGSPRPTDLHLEFIRASEQLVGKPRNGSSQAEIENNEEALRSSMIAPKRAQRKLVVSKSHADQNAEKGTDGRIMAESKRPQHTDDASPQGAEKLNRAERTAPVDQLRQQQLKRHTRRKQDHLHAVLGGLFLVLVAVGIWRLLDLDIPWPGTNIEPTVRQTLSSKTTDELFVVQSERIQQALRTLDCVLSEGRENKQGCDSNAQ